MSEAPELIALRVALAHLVALDIPEFEVRLTNLFRSGEISTYAKELTGEPARGAMIAKAEVRIPSAFWASATLVREQTSIRAVSRCRFEEWLPADPGWMLVPPIDYTAIGFGSIETSSSPFGRYRPSWKISATATPRPFRVRQLLTFRRAREGVRLKWTGRL